MKRALVLLAAVLVIGAAVYGVGGTQGVLPSVSEAVDAVRGRADTTEPAASPVPASRSFPDSLQRWKAFASPAAHGWRVRLRHPPGVRAEAGPGRAGHVRLLSVGPENDPPALTDGFSMTISIDARSPSTSLRAYVDAQVNEGPPKREVRRSVRDTTLLEQPAFTWAQVSGLGTVVEHRALALDDRTVATITRSVVGAEPAADRQTIDAILQTLQFEPASAAPASPMSPADDRSGKRGDPGGSASERVELALLASPTGSAERGCDDVVYADHWVAGPAATPSARLTETLKALFTIDTDSVHGHRHFLGRTNETLALDSARVADGEAKVYLSGRLSGLRGACDHPRARIQIEETARRFPTVDRVTLYRNGRPTDLTPSGR